jgi:hypothetical protein
VVNCDSLKEYRSILKPMSFNIEPLRKKRWLATPRVFQDAVDMATGETTPYHLNLLIWSGVGLCSLSCPLRDDGFARRDFHRLVIPVDPSAAVRAPLARIEGAGDEGDHQPDLPLARG